MRRRAVSALLMSVMALAAIGIPAVSAGSGSVRVVDDDGRATAGDCGANATARQRIQRAVADAAPGDTVLVCPGTYTEQVRIGKDDLTLRSKVASAAVIRAPLVLGEGAPDIVRIKPGADGVTVSGFTILARAPGGSTPSGGECAISAAVSVEGFDAIVSHNRIRVSGPETLGACGYEVGVRVGDGESMGPAGEPPPAPELPTASARVIHNDIVDFKSAGVLILAGGDAVVDANRIRYLHENYPSDFDGGPTPTRAIAPSGWGAQATGGPTFGGGAYGIGALFLSAAKIRDNDIRSGEHAQSNGLSAAGMFGSAGTPTGVEDDSTPMLGSGILILFNSEGPPPDAGFVAEVEVARNRVVRAQLGIEQGFNVDVRVANNLLVNGDIGHVMYQTYRAEITENSAGANFAGIAIFDGEDNTFLDNHARGNLEVDCYDATEGEGTEGTANTWTDNIGNISSPDGICRPELIN